MVRILYIGSHPQILETVVRLINTNPEWFGIGASDRNAAVNLFTTQPFDLVLFGCGIEQNDEDALLIILRQLKSDIKIIQHYGGGSGLLQSEILMALNQ